MKCEMIVAMLSKWQWGGQCGSDTDSCFIILWPYCSWRNNDGGKNTKIAMAIHNVYNVSDDGHWWW